jgi:hypothetical protein
MEASLRGRTAGKGLKGKSMSMDTLEQRPDARREGQGAAPASQNVSASPSPLAIVALSALGIILGGAIVLQCSPFGSLGRYQFILLRNSTIVRMDTTSGNLSACYYGSGGIGQPPNCFPWSETSRHFMSSKDTGAVQ